MVAGEEDSGASDGHFGGRRWSRLLCLHTCVLEGRELRHLSFVIRAFFFFVDLRALIK